jgi:outer membrane translocation and assembly module TamA
MRLWRGLFILPFFVVAVHAQESAAPEPTRLRTLMLISSTLPEPLRQEVIQGLQGIVIDPKAEELRERVRQYLLDAGYYNARVDDGQISAVPDTSAGRFADVSFRVDPGLVYMLGEIHFEGGHVFSAEEVRLQFPTRTGEHFNAAEIGQGLENLKNLSRQGAMQISVRFRSR